jgi:DNA repair exonuclease SbcCD ATPase subunit
VRGLSLVEISEDLRDLVTSTISSVKEGLKKEKCGVSGTIKFEVTVAKSKNAQTGFKIFVADASGNYTKDNTSKITFEIAGILSESEKADLKNQIDQLQGSLNSCNSEKLRLASEIANLKKEVEDKKTSVIIKHEELEECRNKLRDETKKLTEKVEVAERERDSIRSQVAELSHKNEVLEAELKKNPRIVVT